MRSVRRLVRETTLSADVAAAPRRFRKLNESMVHDDIQTGYWLAQLANVTYVSIERSDKHEPTTGPYRGMWTRQRSRRGGCASR